MKKAKIIYLDDHLLYQKGMEQAIDPSLKKFYVLNFHHPDQALKYIYNSLSENDPIDLIITDFNHPGKDGYEFAKEIREYELELGKEKSLPILLISMACEIKGGSDEELITKIEQNKFNERPEFYIEGKKHIDKINLGRELGYFNSTISKNSSPNKVLSEIYRLIGNPYKGNSKI